MGRELCDVSPRTLLRRPYKAVNETSSRHVVAGHAPKPAHVERRTVVTKSEVMLSTAVFRISQTNALLRRTEEALRLVIAAAPLALGARATGRSRGDFCLP